MLQAQDVRWSQPNLRPLDLNPANAGAFHGTARISGIYRTQDQSIANTGYQSYGFGLDIPIVRGFRDVDWVGFGFGLTQDKSGVLDQSWSISQLVASYHFALQKKKPTSYLTLGFGFESFGAQFKGLAAAEDAYGTGSLQGYNGNGENKSGNGYNVGLLYRGSFQSSNLSIGWRMRHIGNLKKEQINTSFKLASRMAIHASYEYFFKKNLSWTNQFVYDDISSINEFVWQSKVNFLLKEKKQMWLNTGLGYRFGDALEILVGMQIKDFNFGIAYDLPMSSRASESRPLGAFEIGAQYIMKIYKKPKSDPIIFCPRF